MRNLFTLIFIFLQITVYCQISKTAYQREIKIFLEDVLHDSTHYTVIDHLNDSLAARSDEEIFIPRKLDTTDLKYNIHTEHYRYKFEKIVILDSAGRLYGPASFMFKKSDSLKMAQLASFIDEIDSNRLKQINNILNKWTTEYFDERFVSREELKKLFDNDNSEGWRKYREIYGAPYLTFSTPVFNSTYDIAYFEWSVVCGGLCGAGYSCFYKRINGKWKLMLIRQDWVS